MSAVHEEFSLDRNVSIEKDIDPTGKKWVVHAGRGSALSYAQPDPGSTVSVIPKEFAGKWTSPSVLRGLVRQWVTKQWDKADEVARINALKQGRGSLPDHVVEEPVVVKQTPEESLAALDPEIADTLGDIIRVDEPVVEEKPKTPLKKKAKKKG